MNNIYSLAIIIDRNKYLNLNNYQFEILTKLIQQYQFEVVNQMSKEQIYAAIQTESI